MPSILSLDFQANREKGRRPLYFPERYGEVLGTGEYDKKGKFALVYKAGKLGNIMISLEISADDIILIYNKYVIIYTLRFYVYGVCAWITYRHYLQHERVVSHIQTRAEGDGCTPDTDACKDCKWLVQLSNFRNLSAR